MDCPLPASFIVRLGQEDFLPRGADGQVKAFSHSQTGDALEPGEEARFPHGKLLWEVDIEGFETYGATDGDTLFLSTKNNGGMIAMDMVDGEVKWRANFSEAMVAQAMCLERNGIYSVNNEKTIFKLSTTDGSVLWSKEFEHELNWFPVCADNGIYIGSKYQREGGYSGEESQDNYVLRFDPDDGTLLWNTTINVNATLMNTGAIADGKLYTLDWLSAEEGEGNTWLTVFNGAGDIIGGDDDGGGGSGVPFPGGVPVLLVLGMIGLVMGRRRRG